MTDISLQPKTKRKDSTFDLRQFLLKNSFTVVLVLVVIFFSLATSSFLTVNNIISLLHAAVPLMLIASGLGMVVITGKLDISVGSIALVTTSVGTLLIVRHDFDPLITLLILLPLGLLIGAMNGFIVVVLKVNPLITTLGTMILLRGVGLELTKSTNISLPEDVRRLGNLTLDIGSVSIFVDIIIALLLMLAVHVLHTRTSFGRWVVAIGNDEETAARLGVPVKTVTFLTFVLSGLLATIGGILLVLQVGSVSGNIGSGMEFVAVAAVVIGGISLFGGEGSILPGVLRGVLTLQIIFNGLNHLGADPYAYRFVNGAVIFVAMYADSLRSRLPDYIKAFGNNRSEQQPEAAAVPK